MKKRTFLVLVVALIASAMAFAGGDKEEKSSYKLGFIGPLTGDNANYGTMSRDAAYLAAEHFNAAGGINGIPVEIIAEDSEGTVEKGLSAIEKLANTDKISGLIGPVFTSTTIAVGDRVQNEGIPLITGSATFSDLTNIGDMVFRTVVSDGLQGEVAGHYFYEVLGYRNLAVLYAKNDYSQGLYESMSATFESLGGTIIDAESFMVGDKDFKTQLTKIKQVNADAIYIPNYTVEMAQILEQASQLGVDAPFLSCDGFSDPEIYNLAGNFTDGVVYVAPAQVEKSDLYTEFAKDYTEHFGIAPDSFATNAYDATNVMLQALTRAVANGDDSRQALRDEIAKTKDFKGASGIVNFAPNGDLIANQGVYKVEGTTPVYIGAFAVVDGKLSKVE
ncbi:MAG: ABC transporter substrate-binding protein [Sphaerochaetaceae bacterium]|nr:ABC transporter substrate-binding protein [Sphaerochaetaceae bacterium]